MKLDRRGFTLAEFLAVIAIFALLLAVAVPNLMLASASWEKKRLDDAAEELFLYAQNHLAYIRSTHSSRILDDAELIENGRAYYFFGEGIGSGLLAGAQLNGCAVLAVDPPSLTAVDIYYSEKHGLEELKSLVLGGEIRQIGYYGGGGDIFSPRGNPLLPRVEFLNGDELYIDFYCDSLNGSNLADFFAKITFSSENSELTEEVSDLSFDGNSLHGRVLVDRIEPNGGSYYLNHYSPALGAPDSLTANVRIYQRIGSEVNVTSELSSAERSVTFSPLFANKVGEEIEIASVRHLNNLRFLPLSPAVSVKQTADIDFHSVEFLPISEFCGTFDGCGNRIINPKIRASNGCAGIFERMAGSIKDVHIVGNGDFAVCGNPINVGMLCAVAENGSLIENCTIKDIFLDVSANSDISVGGLVGIAKGRITSSRAACSITVSANSAKVGGIAGTLDGGKIELSRSSGRLSFNGNGAISQVAGIATGSGEISDCYSECSAGYISGAQYFGVCPPEIVGANRRFLRENAWLAAEIDGAVSGESYNLAEPRGLVGIVSVEYSSGEYVNNLLADFDAYGNNSKNCPQILWENPSESESRYFLFRSASAFPKKGEPSGWDCIFDSASLGSERMSGGFVYQQILLDGEKADARLRFGNEERSVTLENEQKAEPKIGKIGVVAVISRIYSEWSDETFEEIFEEMFDYHYYYRDFATGLSGWFSLDDADDENALTEMSAFTFVRETENDDEIRVYVFADDDSERLFGDEFMLDDKLFAAPIAASGLNYHEWLGGWADGERFEVEIGLADGKKMRVPMTVYDGWFGVEVVVESGWVE